MKDRTRALLSLAAGLALVVGCMLLPGAALGKAQSARPSYWGAWIGSQLTGVEPPADMSAVSRFEQVVGKAPSLLETSIPFSSCQAHRCEPVPFPAAGLQRFREAGAIPVLSWSSDQSGEGDQAPKIPLSALINGSYDSYIRGFAEEARAWGQPFFLRFNWEMNGSWMSWSVGVNGNQPGEFVAAWRHVHDIFTSVGATNATWVWCPYPDPHRRFQPLKPLYPGGRYVDWTCIDAFNWGANPANPVPWMSFEHIFDSTYSRIVNHIAPHKPVMIAELGSTGSPTAKAMWIRNMFKGFRTKYRRVRGIIWFEKIDRGVDWLLEDNPMAAGAFSRGIRRGYRPAVYSGLSESPIRPPSR